jgi:hypothetical protein
MISALHGWQSMPISLSALKGFLGFDPQPKSTEIFSAVSMGWRFIGHSMYGSGFGGIVLHFF